MHDKIKPIIDSVTPMSSRAIEKVQDLVQFLTLEKGDFITEVGQRDNFEYFVLDGICKSFLFNPEGEEITLSFFMSNSIISPFTTRNKDGQSILNIKFLTKMEVATLHAEKFEQLMIDDHEIRHFGNTVLRNELMAKVDKEIGLASLPAKSRLQILRTKYPNIENCIAHADIASYLGITTISLSRLRTQS
ncbi:Crp/Fnr family transcriptional regulator [Aurantibacter crassamenti]|uniref:Crp/Fnr family transcriptional regulator n=1 Tax=Aurantibacter crassamenti TaxID=1837375 RepID=UPI00193983F7|nr:Crp/Fnr family transcriptional regulator [Aurantibacter crassamenti]MBM1107018.1 Crp/Fnr family transcriptional regulator [Aurantibacter crassamenti]